MTILLEMLGLYLLAASMPQHRGILLGGWRSIASPRLVAVAGWTLLALSLLLAAEHRPTAVVTWFGLLPLACGAILLGLSFAPRLVRAFLLAALAGGLTALFLV